MRLCKQLKKMYFLVPLDLNTELIWRQNKEQAAKLNQNNKQYLFGKNYNMWQQKGVNPINQPYMDQRKKSPTNVNFIYSANQENPDKAGQPCSFNLFRSQRSKLLQQQKDKFRHKYSKFTGDSKQPKDDSIKLDPLINPSRLCFSKTKVPDDFRLMSGDRKIGNIGDQSKTKILRSKEKLGSLQTNNGYDFQGKTESIVNNDISIVYNDTSIQKQNSDFKMKCIQRLRNDQEPEDSKRGNTSDFFYGRRSEVVKNNQDLSLGTPV